MIEKIKDQILAIRDSGITNMFDVKKVFEIAERKEFKELANFIFERTNHYTKFILTGDDTYLEQK